MAIPDFQTLMLPMLELAADGATQSLADTRERLAERFALTATDRTQRVPSGRQTVLANRVAWARCYLGMAGLLETPEETPKRGRFRITGRGRDVLAHPPARITIRYLSQFPGFDDARRGGANTAIDAPGAGAAVSDEMLVSPDEALDRAYASLRNAVAAELLERLKAASSVFFERVVVDLMVRLGYGGSIEDAGQAVGRSGDGGIDGIIKEDRLGLDTIYLQAKRWDGVVGRPEVQAFVGALSGRGARKGVFLTTGTYSQPAEQYARQITAHQIVLIDGPRLVDLMIDTGLGVSLARRYDVPRVDGDFFVED